MILYFIQKTEDNLVLVDGCAKNDEFSALALDSEKGL